MTWMTHWSRTLTGVMPLALLLGSQHLAEADGVPLPQPVAVSAVDGKVDSPLNAVFGKVTVPSSTPDGPQTIGVRAYALPDAAKPKIGSPLLPGPTFVFQPGDLLRLRLGNYMNPNENPWLNAFNATIPGAKGPGQGDSIPENVPHEISIPNGSDLTNLHVHGLHVDPKQDNVTLLVLPEDSDPSSLVPEMQRFVPTINRWWTRAYQYQIPDDHLPGTYWYHAHKHGSTSAQLENGMAGTLVMLPKDDNDNIVPGLWNNDPAKTHDRVLVIQQLQQFASSQGFIKGLAKGSGLGRQMRAALAAGNPLTNFTAVNGVIRPSLQLPVGQVERWRFVIAGANHTSSSDIWVGSITPELKDDLYVALNAINSQKDLDTLKKDGTFLKTVANQAVLVCTPISGSVRLTALDGITMWQSRPITPSTPAMGSAGNRLELLVQVTAPPAEKTNPYRVYQNYPVDITDLAARYPKLFGEEAGAAANLRFQALTTLNLDNGKPAYVVQDSSGNPLPPNQFNLDTYALKSDCQGFTVPLWANVDPNGAPSDDPAKGMSLAPLIAGVRNNDTNGIDPVIRAQDISQQPVGWQPLPDRYTPPTSGAGAVTSTVLFDLDLQGTATGPQMPTVEELDKTMDALSPAGSGSRLKQVDSQGELVPGIPAYVGKFPPKTDGRQAVVFDRGQFTFNYVEKSVPQTLAFRQFWLNGRQFNIDDFQGNPNADALIQTPLMNVAPELGTYLPNDGSKPQGWTNQVQGQTYVTNPGYYVPIKTYKDAKGNVVYNYDYANPGIRNNKAVTGLDESTPPVSTTNEEWLLINNSDLFHPFHIHISPFFVTEIGQLNYDKTQPVGKQWGFNKLTLDDARDQTKPFSWVVGNWWDVITLPPHGYVKIKTWINVPSQFPRDKANPDSDLMVKDNANVYGSWVLHCHILRHEDRGMMTMVNTVPRLTSLNGTWADQTKDNAKNPHVIADVRGGLTVSDAGASGYSGTFAGGVGNPLLSQPWLGSMSPTKKNTGPFSFCVNLNANMIVLSSGDIWWLNSPPDEKNPPIDRTLPVVEPRTFQPATDVDLTGTWEDDHHNQAKIDDKDGQLTYTPISGVWWGRGTGTWVPPTKDSANYVGSQILTNGTQIQTLTFCVSSDLETMVFGNGITWRRISKE
jgi:FtsP/CotA-like multicopper oxidase with cupredoxin domain